MKRYRINSGSSPVLDAISYASISELKTLIKYLLTSDRIAEDEAQICLVADLKTYLGLYETKNDLKILTSKQRVVIIEHLINDRTQMDLAEELEITQQGVSVLLNSALNRIRNYILNGKLNWIEWTEDEKVFLMQNYGKVSVTRISKRLGRPAGTVKSMYHYLKRREDV